MKKKVIPLEGNKTQAYVSDCFAAAAKKMERKNFTANWFDFE